MAQMVAGEALVSMIFLQAPDDELMAFICATTLAGLQLALAGVDALNVITSSAARIADWGNFIFNLLPPLFQFHWAISRLPEIS
jgi:hypothetical protein